jgi:hypothetical protein
MLDDVCKSQPCSTCTNADHSELALGVDGLLVYQLWSEANRRKLGEGLVKSRDYMVMGRMYQNTNTGFSFLWGSFLWGGGGFRTIKPSSNSKKLHLRACAHA